MFWHVVLTNQNFPDLNILLFSYPTMIVEIKQRTQKPLNVLLETIQKKNMQN